VYTLNAVKFNTKYGTFATFGSDGNFTTWNKDTKSKYFGSKTFPQSVQAADFSDNA